MHSRRDFLEQAGQFTGGLMAAATLDSLISAEQKSLTAELTSANEIMQQLPSELQGVNELYSAITGYNQQTNG